MFNPKFSLISAAVAFILSFLIGLLSGAAFLAVLLRALSFSVAFFVLSFVAYWLLARYIPELLSPEGDGTDSDQEGRESEATAIGARVDVSVGDDEDYTGSENPSPDDAEENTVALDQNDKDGYTEDVLVSSASAPSTGAVPALPAGYRDDVDVLPDLDGMSDSFVSPIADESTGNDHPGTPRKQRGAGGDSGSFDSHEMAAAIQTLLKRDQKG